MQFPTLFTLGNFLQLGDTQGGIGGCFVEGSVQQGLADGGGFILLELSVDDVGDLLFRELVPEA